MAMGMRTRLHRVSIAFAMACVTSGSSSIANAAPSAAERAQAEALFRDARTLLTAGNVAEACGKLAESQRLDPQLGTELNLALCHAKQGKTASAWVELREVAERAETAKDQERAQFARAQIAQLEKKLSRIRVVVDKTPQAGLVVTLDGEALGASAMGTALPVDPGDHVIAASAPGKKPWTQTTRLEAAGDFDVKIPLLADASGDAPPTAVPPAAAKPAEHDAPQPSDGRSPAVGYALLGAGVVGLGVGTIFGLRTLSKKSDADAECPNDLCTSTGHDLEGEARTSSIISTIGFGVGIAAVAGGVIWLVTAKPKPSAAATIRIVPTGPGARLEATW